VFGKIGLLASMLGFGFAYFVFLLLNSSRVYVLRQTNLMNFFLVLNIHLLISFFVVLLKSRCFLEFDGRLEKNWCCFVHTGWP